MAIKNANATPTAATGDIATPVTPVQPSHTAQPQPQRNNSFLGGLGQHRRRLSSAAGNETVLKLQQMMNLIIEEDGGRIAELGWPDSISTFVVDAATHGTQFSSILILHERMLMGGRNAVSVHIALVEKSAPPLTKQQRQLAGRAYEMVMTPGDSITPQLWNTIKQIVNGIPKFANHDVIEAGDVVIPTELDPENRQDVTKMLSVAVEAVLELMSQYDSGDVYIPLTAADFNVPNMRIISRVDYTPLAETNAISLPTRMDITLSTVATQPASFDPQQIVETSICDIGGYVEAVYVGQAAPNAYGQQPMSQHYVPRLVLTDLYCDGAISAEGLLMALGSSRVLSHNYGWANVFKPKYSANGLHPRDIGALTLDAPKIIEPGNATPKRVRVDTKSTAFVFQQFVRDAFYNTMLYSVDVDEHGPMTWIMSLFPLAAANNPTGISHIIAAADKLTNGNFSARWAGGRIIQDDLNRIHLGYYLGEGGKPVDVRTVDYLAYLNRFGENEIKEVWDFDATFDSNSPIPLELRLADRLVHLERAVGQTIRVTGYARRYTFTEAFINTLADAMAAAGMVINPTNLQEAAGNQNMRRTYDSLQGLTVAGTVNSGLFQGFGNGSAPGTSMYQQRDFYRPTF